MGHLSRGQHARSDLRLRLSGEHGHLLDVRVVAVAAARRIDRTGYHDAHPAGRRDDGVHGARRGHLLGRITAHCRRHRVQPAARDGPDPRRLLRRSLRSGGVDQGHRAERGDDRALAARLLPRGRAGVDARHHRVEGVRRGAGRGVRHARRRNDVHWPVPVRLVERRRPPHGHQIRRLLEWGRQGRLDRLRRRARREHVDVGPAERRHRRLVHPGHLDDRPPRFGSRRHRHGSARRSPRRR